MNIVQGLKIKVGVRPQQSEQQVTVAQNSDAQFLLYFFDELGFELDVTAATALALSVLESDGSTVLSKTLIAGIILVAGQKNQALVSMAAADFALLPAGDSDLAISLGLAGENYVFNVYAGLSVQPAVV